MDFQDSLDYRVNQMVNDTAEPSSATGVGGTATVNGNDAVGQINIQTGTKTGVGSLIHVTFAEPYNANGSQPFVQVIPEDVPPPADWYVSINWTGWDIWVGTPPKPNTNYAFNYTVVARPWPMYLSPNGQPVNSLDKTENG